MIGMLQGRLHPTVAWRSLPMILGGGSTIDFLPPMIDVFLRMKWMERDRKVLGASVNMCHPWNDHPALGWSTSVVTDRDPALAERLADELASRCWEKRHKQPPVFATPEEAIREARDARIARKLGVVMIADASDVVTAGAPGENTAILERLLEDGKGMIAYVPLRDPAAVGELWSVPVGREVEISVGGKLDPARGEALIVKGRVQNKTHLPGFERMVVLAAGDVRLVLMEGPAITIKPSFFQGVGLDPWKADIVVVKNFFPFLLFFAPMNRKTIFVKTHGVTDFDAARQLTFDGPVHPFGAVSDWRAADARRRGLSSS